VFFFKKNTIYLKYKNTIKIKKKMKNCPRWNSFFVQKRMI